MSRTQILGGATRKRSDVPLDQLLESIGNIRDARWKGKPVRYIPESDGLWFVLADVLVALDYKVKPSHVKKALRAEECRLMEIGVKSALANCVNMTGLLKILSFSGKPDAPDFLEWAREVERGVKL